MQRQSFPAPRYLGVGTVQRRQLSLLPRILPRPGGFRQPRPPAPQSWISPYDAAFATQQQQQQQNQVTEWTDAYVDSIVQDFGSQQSQYLLGAGENVSANQSGDVFVPQVYESQVEQGFESFVTPGTSAPLNRSEPSFSKADLDYAVTKALKLQSDAQQEEAKKRRAEILRKQVEQEREQSLSQARKRHQDIYGTDSGLEIPSAGVKRQLPKNFEVSEASDLKVVIRKKTAKPKQEVIYVDNDDDEDEIDLAGVGEIEQLNESIQADSGVGTDLISEDSNYITLKVPKDKVTKEKLIDIRQKLREDAVSLTDEQVLSSPVHLLSVSDRRRRDLLLQSNRQKRHMAKQIEQKGKSAVRKQVAARVQKHRRSRELDEDDVEDEIEDEDEAEEDTSLEITPQPARKQRSTSATPATPRTPATPASGSKRPTECTMQMCKTERDKLRKRRQRAKLSDFFLHKVRKYDCARAAKRRKKEKDKSVVRKSECAIRKERSRNLNKLNLKDSTEYEHVLKNVVNVAAASPAKQEELFKCLDQRFETNLSAKKVEFKNPVCLLRSLKDKNRKSEHEALVQKIKDHFGSVTDAAAYFGVNKKPFRKLCTMTDKKPTNRVIQFEERKNNVKQFFNQESVSKALPIARHAKKRFMSTTYEEAYPVYQAWCEEHKVQPVAFTTYSRLKPDNIFSITDVPLQECCCKQCVNLRYLKMSLVTNKVQELPAKTSEAILQTLCSDVTDVRYIKGVAYGKYTCIKRKCASCGVHKLKEVISNANGNLLQDKSIVTWKRWQTPSEHAGLSKGKRTGRKSGESTSERSDLFVNRGTKIELLELFLMDLSAMAEHVFHWKWHDQQFDLIKKNLKENMVLQVLDFSQNFLNKYQDEIQTMHWHHAQTVLHPIVNYYLCPICADGSVVTEEHIMITSDLVHDKFAVREFERVTLEALQEHGINPSCLVQFCDNCGRQYKSYGPLEFLSLVVIPTIRSFFGESHAKGPSDSAAGRVKQMVRQAIKNREVIIREAEDFFQFLEEKFRKLHEKRVATGKCVHFKQYAFLVENIDRNCKLSGTTVRGTKSFHSVRSTGNEYIIEAREVACLCDDCLHSTSTACQNTDYASKWVQYDVRTGKAVKEAVPNMHWPVGVTDSVTDDATAHSNTESEISQMEELQAKIAQSTSPEHLQSIIDQNDLRILPNMEGSVQTCHNNETVYSIAQNLIPGDIGDGYKALPIFGDGNCWVRSVSKALHNNDTVFLQELRLNIVVEGLVHRDRYFTDEYMKLGCDKVYTTPLPIVFAQYSGEELDFGEGYAGENRNQRIARMLEASHQIYNREMYSFRQSGAYAGLWQQLQTTNCIHRPIKVVFPQRGSKNFRFDFHRIFYPWEEADRQKEPIVIMWTPMSARRNAVINHFVPLMKPQQRSSRVSLQDRFNEDEEETKPPSAKKKTPAKKTPKAKAPRKKIAAPKATGRTSKRKATNITTKPTPRYGKRSSSKVQEEQDEGKKVEVTYEEFKQNLQKMEAIKSTRVEMELENITKTPFPDLMSQVKDMSAVDLLTLLKSGVQEKTGEKQGKGNKSESEEKKQGEEKHKKAVSNTRQKKEKNTKSSKKDSEVLGEKGRDKRAETPVKDCFVNVPRVSNKSPVKVVNSDSLEKDIKYAAQVLENDIKKQEMEKSEGKADDESEYSSESSHGIPLTEAQVAELELRRKESNKEDTESEYSSESSHGVYLTEDQMDEIKSKGHTTINPGHIANVTDGVTDDVHETDPAPIDLSKDKGKEDANKIDGKTIAEIVVDACVTGLNKYPPSGSDSELSVSLLEPDQEDTSFALPPPTRAAPRVARKVLAEDVEKQQAKNDIAVTDDDSNYEKEDEPEQENTSFALPPPSRAAPRVARKVLAEDVEKQEGKNDTAVTDNDDSNSENEDETENEEQNDDDSVNENQTEQETENEDKTDDDTEIDEKNDDTNGESDCKVSAASDGSDGESESDGLKNADDIDSAAILPKVSMPPESMRRFHAEDYVLVTKGNEQLPARFVDYDTEDYDETKPIPDFASVYFFTKSKHGWIPNDTIYSVPSISVSQMTGKIEEIQMSSTRKCFKFEVLPGLDMQ